MQHKKIHETIVVEGRDDERAVKQAVDADVIVTHGYGIKESTFERIQWAADRNGVIVFTDPDTAGEMIRKRINCRVKGCRNAFLSKEEAYKKGDIGIENAGIDSIQNALLHARASVGTSMTVFSMKDLIQNNLAGTPGSADNREKVGTLLRIGYGNAKQFLIRLNHYGISMAEFKRAMESSGLELSQ